MPPGIELSPTARTLIGAYFSHEYSVEAAALCNPSMVPHPDQTGLEPGELRVAISLRQIGEGHISSIGFCSAILGQGDRIRLEERDGPLMIGHRVGAKHMRFQLSAAMVDEDIVLRLKPMNCPSHMTLYNEMGVHSYRELPLRFAEFATLYRYEISGTLSGLTRVRALTQPTHDRSTH